MAINAGQTLILNALGLVPLYDIWMSKAVVADEYPCEEFKKNEEIKIRYLGVVA